MRINRRIMKTNRRKVLTAGLAGGIAAAALPLSSFGRLDADNPNYAKLDAVLDQPTFKKELFADPVIIESVELLRYGRSFLCRVRSKDGAEGISVAHNTMSVLYPIFVNRLQPFFVNQDARRLDELVEKALVFAFNFRLGGLGIGISIDVFTWSKLLRTRGLEIQVQVLNGHPLGTLPSLPVGTGAIVRGQSRAAIQYNDGQRGKKGHRSGMSVY